MNFEFALFTGLSVVGAMAALALWVSFFWSDDDI